MYADPEEENNDRQHEPEALRNLSKRAIVKILGLQWVLPDGKSRAMSRRYLCGVYQNSYFRVGRIQLLQFEAVLNPEDFLRTSDQSMSTLVDKGDQLLRELGHAEFGFEGNAWPDEAWLYRILRYVDQANVLRVFKRQVQNAPLPPGNLGRV